MTSTVSSGRLAGRKAFILGAGAPGSIGGAIARRFRDEGATVVIGARDEAKAGPVAAQSGALGVVRLDILDEQSIAQGMTAAAEKLGGLDIALNAAGVNRAMPIADETAEGLLTQARIHFVGATLFIKEAAALMGRGGSIITMSSLTVELTTVGLGAYAASKAAADKIVRVAAVEYGDRGIRVNSLAPGLTSTPMTRGYFDNEKIVGAFQRETPRGKLSAPEDVAAAAVWLASDECVATGDLVRVSGGAHLRRLPLAREFV